MCVKFSPGDLNSNPYPPHPTSIYTCGVTIAPRGSGGMTNGLKRSLIREVLQKNISQWIKFKTMIS